MEKAPALQLVFEPPGKDEPGYLKRVKKALALGQELQNGTPTPDMVDAMVAFLLPYVKEPQDREQAEEVLWNVSEAQFTQLMEMMAGNPTSHPEGNSQK